MEVIILKIDKIKKMSNNKYKLHLSNNEKVITYDDVIIKNNLLFNDKIDSELLNKIELDTQYYDIYNKVIKYIGIRLRSKKEIDDYLDKNNILEEDKQIIIDNLKNIGLINDEKFAKAYINDKIYLSNYGPGKIRKDLIEHKIDSIIIEEEIDNIDNTVIEEKINKLITKKVNKNNKYSNYQLKKKIIMELINLGYNSEMIINCFNKFDINTEDIINKQYAKAYNKYSKKHTGKDLYYKIKQYLYQRGFESIEIDNLLKEKVEIE